MMNKKSIMQGNKKIQDSIGMLGLTTLLTGGIMKMMGDIMFGLGEEKEKIPKGVVAEMTQGMVRGFFEEFHDKELEINSLKQDLEETEEKLKEVEKQKRESEQRWESLQEALAKAEEMKAEAEKKVREMQKKDGDKDTKVKKK